MQALASLAVVGAGPKGLAIAAKRAALARTGREVPDLVLIDRAGVATNWSGTSGYTDGRQPLSTPPEKDVGFPYAPSWGPASGQVSDQVRRWSWQRYLIDQGGLADWVDRGQPRPDHRAWHRYLRWVAGQLGVEPVLAEVVGIELADGRWRLSTRRRSTGEPLTLDCDGLVLTGPGAPLRLPGQPDHHPRILDGRSFWTAGAALSAGAGPHDIQTLLLAELELPPRPTVLVLDAKQEISEQDAHIAGYAHDDGRALGLTRRGLYLKLRRLGLENSSDVITK